VYEVGLRVSVMMLVMVMQARNDKKGIEEVPISPVPT
jgi:hypothetical protein